MRINLYKKYRAEGYKPPSAKSLAKHEEMYGPGSRKRWIMPTYGEEDTELPGGWKLRVRVEGDNSYAELPWVDECGNGVVLDRLPHSYYDQTNLYWPIGDSRGWYDVKASLAIALEEKWDAKPFGVGTKLEQAMRAVKANYAYLDGYAEGRWSYVGLIVELLDENDRVLEEESCWGFESDATEHLCSEVRSWAAHMVVNQRRAKREAKRQEKIASRFADAMACGV